jgi:Hg(II)-responsive transcriptional regulator
MSTTGLRIRQVADAAGVHVETLRYYERRGILQAPQRTRAGYRQYAPETVELVRFVKRAQGLGFTLDEIEELLALRRPRPGRCSSVQRAASAKIEDIDGKLRGLLAMRAALEQLTAACARNADQLDCPLIEALARDAGGAP